MTRKPLATRSVKSKTFLPAHIYFLTYVITADWVEDVYKRQLLRLDSHPNPLALNLLDNSEAIYRLQRYDVLAVSYTHLDVYKRQGSNVKGG